MPNTELSDASDNTFIRPDLCVCVSDWSHMDSMCCLCLHLCAAEQLVWHEHNEMLFLNKISWYLGFRGAYKTYLTKMLRSHRSHIYTFIKK